MLSKGCEIGGKCLDHGKILLGWSSNLSIGMLSGFICIARCRGSLNIHFAYINKTRFLQLRSRTENSRIFFTGRLAGLRHLF